MPKYVIERAIPEAGQLAANELQAIAQKSNTVLHEMGPRIQWLQTYVTDDKMYCVYIAPDAEAVRDHARRAGFPADSVATIATVIDPSTAEGARV